MSTVLLVLAAVVAGWMFQLYLTFQQSVRFNGAVVGLKRSGTVTVGVGGNRYRGGRAYVAVALDEVGTHGVVTNAITLAGYTTFASAKPLPALVGRTARELAGEADLTGVTRPQRIAARQAVELLLARQGRTTGPQAPAPAA